jgi:hypothetical protein
MPDPKNAKARIPAIIQYVELMLPFFGDLVAY